MNTKLKQELIDLAHLLHQAIITDDDRIAEAALADLIDSVASMKKVKVEGEGEQLMDKPLHDSVVDDHRYPPSEASFAKQSGYSGASRAKFKMLRADKMATMVMRGNLGGQLKPLVAHIQKFDTYCTSEIFRDGDVCPLVDITVYGGFDRTSRVTKGTMRGLMSSLGHKWRMHSNKRARENSATQVNG